MWTPFVNTLINGSLNKNFNHLIEMLTMWKHVQIGIWMTVLIKARKCLLKCFLSISSWPVSLVTLHITRQFWLEVVVAASLFVHSQSI